MQLLRYEFYAYVMFIHYKSYDIDSHDTYGFPDMFHVVASTMEMEMWYSLLTIGIPYCHWFTSKHIIMNMY